MNHQKEIPVVCRSLESLLREGIIDSDIGILKIDTEGNDLQVIQGMSGLVPEVLICEFFTSGLYAGWNGADPDGLIAEVKNRLGLKHYLAIKRLDDFELVSFSPAVFQQKQWGNLVFIHPAIFQSAFEDLRKMVQASEKRIFDMAGNKQALIQTAELDAHQQLTEKIEMLYRVCDERLALINQLTEEAEKRGKIIEQLDHQLKKENKQVYGSD